jgi:hypothetical protein
VSFSPPPHKVKLENSGHELNCGNLAMGSLLTCLRAKEAPGCVHPAQSQHASSRVHQRLRPRSRAAHALLCSRHWSVVGALVRSSL